MSTALIYSSSWLKAKKMSFNLVINMHGISLYLGIAEELNNTNVHQLMWIVPNQLNTYPNTEMLMLWCSAGT